jgi:hypothetical protein
MFAAYAAWSAREIELQALATLATLAQISTPSAAHFIKSHQLLVQKFAADPRSAKILIQSNRIPSIRPQRSTRLRDFSEWHRVMASLLRREHNAHLITGDVAMLTSMKLGLATTLAALSIAAVTFAGADVTSAQSTSVASAPVSYTLEAQVQTLRECDTDLDYLDSFEGMLSDLCALPELPKAPGQPRE